jgi:hypothetical protein
LRNSSNEPLKTSSSLYLAKDRDVVVWILDKEDNTPALELQEDVDGLAIGNKVTTYGKSQGQSLNTRKTEKLKGIGEISIQTQTSSVANKHGGPVILNRTGKVIGVVSHVRKIENSRTSSRRSRYTKYYGFATRIDNLSNEQLVKLDINKYKRDSRLYRDL